MKRKFCVLLLALVFLDPLPGAEAKIPILYSSDLLHPHVDPDDHFDLACLFALPEFDIRGIILDLGELQVKRPGRLPVEQMMRITGRKVSYTIGMSRPLRQQADKALDEPAQFQGGIKLILNVLKNSLEPVTIFTTGSCRDLAAALNREPELFRKKVRAVYINIGCGPNEKQSEYNVTLDQAAYLRVLDSGLPLYWCPCFGKEGYETLYEVDQSQIIAACTPLVQNYFVYCLTRATADPIAFLRTGPHPVPTGKRAMWCTAPMFHAAGRKIYQRSPGDYVALTTAEAAASGLAGKALEVFRFEPIQITVEPGKVEPVFRVQMGSASPNGKVFRKIDPGYVKVMGHCLRNLLVGLGKG